jgi:hypothetical protein
MVGPMIGAERFSERQAITTAIRNRADLLALAQMATEHKMRRAGSQYRGPCPLHGGTHDNFAVDPTHGVYYCHVCGGKGDAFSFVRAWRDCTFADARRFLAAEVGIVVDGPALVAIARAVPERPHFESDAERQRREWRGILNALHSEGCMPSEPPAVYAGLLASLTLGARGQTYLTGRGLEPGAAADSGFRSIDSLAAWRELRSLLADSYVDAELGLAGMQRLPRAWPTPCLVIPYWDAGHLAWLQFRAFDPKADPKYANPSGNAHGIFNADALHAESRVLHIVEGPLDAYTLHTFGLAAVGLPGAKACLGVLSARMASADQEREKSGSTWTTVVLWFDDDKAGRDGCAATVANLRATFGESWVRARVQQADLRGGDVNDVHQRGELDALLASAGFLSSEVAA